MPPRNFVLRQVLVVVITALVLCSGAQADVIRDKALAFRLPLPPGFAIVPDSSVTKPVYEGSLESGEAVFLRINSLQGSLDEESIEHTISQLRMMAEQVSRRSGEWMGEEVVVIVRYETLEGQTFVEQSALIPLAPKAIQLALIGPVEQEQELRSLLSQLLNSLEGESSTQESDGAWAKPAAVALVFLVIAIWWRRAKDEALEDFFSPDGEDDDEAQDASGTAGSKSYVCKVCGLESESNAFCPECIAETMVEA